MLEHNPVITKPELDTYYVAYFDILGYKDYLQKNKNNPEDFLSIIHTVIQDSISNLNTMNFIIAKMSVAQNLFSYRIFSDNILFYYTYTDEYSKKLVLMSFLLLMKEIQLLFICKYGLFIRGAVSKGLFAVSEQFVFGPALVTVVDLESKTACYPRIILDTVIIDELNAPIQDIPEATKKILETMEHAIQNVFLTSTSKELHKRIKDALWAFDKVFFSAQLVIEDIETIKEIRDQFSKLATLSDDAYRLDSSALEKSFTLLRNNFRSIHNLAQKILAQQIRDLEAFNLFLCKNTVFQDIDGFFFVDYLTILDYKMFMSENHPIFLQLLPTLQTIFSSYPDIFLTIQNELNANPKVILKSNLAIHKAVILRNITDNQTNTRVLEKQFWAVRYHNHFCTLQTCKNLIIELPYQSIDG